MAHILEMGRAEGDEMKRYLVFAGEIYYPSGGWSDFEGAFDTLKDAVLCARACRCDWWHIVDIETGQKIAADWQALPEGIDDGGPA